MPVKLKKIGEYEWMIEKGEKPCMKVPAIIFADDFLLKKMQQDLTLEQAANVACLNGIRKASYVMPDGHQGYGFPIGGVAGMDIQENGVIAPGGIGYDINCLHPYTNVLTDYGFKIRIKDLARIAKTTPLKVYETNRGGNDSSKIIFIATRKSDEYVYEITLESGRKLIGSGDHPVLTKEGYRRIQDIRIGDYVVVYPYDGIEYEKPEDTILLDEKDFEGYDKQIIKFLKERNLLPLKLSDNRIGVIARILGYFFGDGSFDIYVEKNGRKRIITYFYGDKKGLEKLREDIQKYFDIKPSRVYVRKRNINIKTQWGTFSTVGREHSIRITSKAFSLLLQKLGAPVGKKTEVEFDVPDWIKKSPLWIKRNFLAGLYGADGSKPSLRTKKEIYTINSISLTMVKNKDKEDNARKYLSSIKDMLREFGVEASIIRVKEYDDRVMLRLEIFSNSKKIYTFLSKIGYEYTGYLETALLFTEYLRRKLNVYSRINSRGNISLVDKNRLMTLLIEDYQTFTKKYGISGGLVLDKVVEVKRIKSDTDKLYDIGVASKAHNFIAEGMVVHNCGVRLLRTNLDEGDVRPRIKELVDTLTRNVPSGLGSEGRIRVSIPELDEVLDRGVEWAVERGYGRPEDPEHIEERGSWKLADSGKVSVRAKKRGAPQLGSLGSGNHFLEVQVVDKIFDERVAKQIGLTHEGQVVVMIHTGSRGLGHQVASDYLQVMERAMRKYGIRPPDRELASLPYNTPEAQDYVRAMAAAANFAWTNRQLITHWTRESFRQVFHEDDDKLGLEIVYDVAHNIAKIEEYDVDGKRRKLVIHRKGATRAFPPGHPEIPNDHKNVGQVVLIPGSMGTASYVLVGTEKGVKTWYTTPHGAGRWMSRGAAIRSYRADQLVHDLAKKGIYIRAASKRVIAEEAPGAYKDVDRVALVADRVGIGRLVARMRPIGVTKG